MPTDLLNKLQPRPVAELVTYLCSEGCRPSGGVFEVAGQWVAKLRWQRSRGVQFREDFTAEDVAERYGEIADFSEGAQYPEDGSSSIHQALASASSAPAKS